MTDSRAPRLQKLHSLVLGVNLRSQLGKVRPVMRTLATSRHNRIVFCRSGCMQLMEPPAPHANAPPRSITFLQGLTGEVNFVSFSNSGKFVAASASGGDAVLLWDVELQRQHIARLPGRSAAAAAFSPDDRILAIVTAVSPGSLGIVLWTCSATAGEASAAWNKTVTIRLDCVPVVHSLSWSRDGTKILVAGGIRLQGSTGFAAVVNVALRKTVLQIATPKACAAAIWGPDETHIAIAQGVEVCMFNAQTGVAVGKPLSGNSFAVNFLTFAADPSFLVAFSCGQVVLWNVVTMQLVQQLRIASDSRATLGPDGESVWTFGEFDEVERVQIVNNPATTNEM